jgi:hypothetical protein
MTGCLNVFRQEWSVALKNLSGLSEHSVCFHGNGRHTLIIGLSRISKDLPHDREQMHN